MVYRVSASINLHKLRKVGSCKKVIIMTIMNIINCWNVFNLAKWLVSNYKHFSRMGFEDRIMNTMRPKRHQILRNSLKLHLYHFNKVITTNYTTLIIHIHQSAPHTEIAKCSSFCVNLWLHLVALICLAVIRLVGQKENMLHDLPMFPIGSSMWPYCVIVTAILATRSFEL